MSAGPAEVYDDTPPKRSPSNRDVARMREEQKAEELKQRDTRQGYVEQEFRGLRLSTPERVRLKGKGRALGLTQDYGTVILFERIEAVEKKLDAVLSLLTDPKGKP